MKKILGTMVLAMLSFFIVAFVFADNAAAGEIVRDGRFFAYDDGTVLDTRTNLMWAAKDNGANINWTNAKSYCENYRGGGYTDWRMPTQDELAGLYDEAKTYKSECPSTMFDRRGYDIHLTELIRLTCNDLWASETSGSSAAQFIFTSAGRGFSPQSFNYPSYRVLPVRSVKSGTFITSKNPPAGEIGKDGRFIAYDNGTVLDTKTNLMWAAKDNGSNINWANAKSYCENYSGGGYIDWRMPTQDQLADLYDSSKSYMATQRDYKVKLTELIQLSACCPWATETRVSEAAYFYYSTGERYMGRKSYDSNYRALPVRTVK
jgi:hypothetical protein